MSSSIEKQISAALPLPALPRVYTPQVGENEKKNEISFRKHRHTHQYIYRCAGNRDKHIKV